LRPRARERERERESGRAKCRKRRFSALKSLAEKKKKKTTWKGEEEYGICGSCDIDCGCLFLLG
jgi:hypothetical protein